MARVFISYRRADGQYAVGWIAERLRHLDGVADLRTEFNDADLRCGDDFPDRLAAEIARCDVLIALIGPHWRGERADGAARILDPTDWVGRELTEALAHGTRVMPVLLAGAEPLQASDLRPELADLADLHAIRFDNAADLDDLVEHLRSHLDELDRERARAEGLDQPIVVPVPRPPWRVVVLAVLAALVGAGVGWLVASVGAKDFHDDHWVALSSLEVTVWSLLAVLGVWFHRALFDGAVRIRWRSVAYAVALAALLIAWAVATFLPSEHTPEWYALRTWAQATLALGLLGPWILMMIGAGCADTIGSGLGARVRAIALHRRSLAVATPAVVLGLVPTVFTTAALDPGNERQLSLGFLLAFVIAGGIEFGLLSLRRDSDLARRELVDLASRHRAHAEAVLIGERAALWSWTLLWCLVPPIVAVAIAVAG